jgi:hypothetical protein
VYLYYKYKYIILYKIKRSKIYSRLHESLIRRIKTDADNEKIMDEIMAIATKVLRSPYYLSFKIQEDISNRYGLNMDAWYWLKLLLPETAAKEIDTAEKSLGKQFELLFMFMAITIWTIWAWWVFPLAIIAIIYIYYWPLTNSNTNLAFKQSLAFDLYRSELYKTFGFPLPKSRDEERSGAYELMEHLRSIRESRVKNYMPF